MIPALDPNGRLPPGRWPATLYETYLQFVVRAGNTPERRQIFKVFRVYASMAKQLFPGVRLWVDGGFVTWKPDAPHDIDVVMVVDRSTVGAVGFDDVVPLLSILDGTVTALEQTFVLGRKLQPFGGLVDGFLVVDTNLQSLDVWHNRWSSVKNEPGERKGYLEVTP